MKKTLGLITVVVALGITASMDAEAKRLGGARSSGMQRQNVTAPANPPASTPGANPSPAQAAPAAAPAAATAAAPAAAAGAKRSWMGPIAGLAAGLGIAALASYLGFGEALANLLMIGLLVMAVLLVVGLVLRKRAGAVPAAAGAGGFSGMSRQAPEAPMARSAEGYGSQGSMIGSRIGSGLQPAAATTGGHIPADFDVPGFVRNAKAHFLALQAANDAGDLGRLREFLTPQMYQEVRDDLHARGEAAQQTQVFGLEAQLLDVAQDGGDWVASVRFTGSIREQHGAVPEDLDEIWHLTKPRQGQGGWVVAGIQQA